MRQYLQFSVLVSLLLSITISPSRAEDWLPPGSTTEMVQDKPAEYLRDEVRISDAFLYGRLLFRSPSLLGEKAVRIGLSCDSCHTNGHVNTGFYINGLSDEPGTIDVTHGFWQAGFEDNTHNPITIPTLRGVKETAPYGTNVIHPDLPAFTRHVISVEFDGPAPTNEQMSALVTYMNALDIKELTAKDRQPSTTIDMSYIPLLDIPLEQQDLSKIAELVDLIRADFGRGLTAGNETEITHKVQLLRAIRRAATAGDFDTARRLYQSLI